MLVFLYSLIQVIVTTVVVSVFHLKMDDLFLKVAVGFLLLMFILVQTLLINLSQKLKLLIRIYNVRENFSLIITNSRILVPVLLIEGSWIHFIKDSNLGFVSVPFDQIESFVVEPSRGLKRITPPYFKIKIKKIDQVLFLTRKEFYNQVCRSFSAGILDKMLGKTY